MSEIFRIAVSVATPLALLGLVAALGYFAYTRKLTHEETQLEALPPDQRATAADEYLTRYGINGKDLAPADKLTLIQDEMGKRHRRAIGYVIVAAVVFVICFGLAVLAYVFQPSHTSVPTEKHSKGFLQLNTIDILMQYSALAPGRQFGGNFRSVNPVPERIINTFGYSQAYVENVDEQTDRRVRMRFEKELMPIHEQYLAGKIKGPEVGVGPGIWTTVLTPPLTQREVERL